MLTSQTWLISSWPWNLFEKHVFPLSFSPLCLDITKLWPSKSYFCRTESYIIEGDFALALTSCVLCCYWCFWQPERWQFLNNGSCLDWSFCHHHHQSILVGVGGQKSQTNGLVTGTLFFSSLSSCFTLVSHFAQNAAFTLACVAGGIVWVRD